MVIDHSWCDIETLYVVVNEIYYTMYKSINGFKNMTRIFSHNNLQTTIRKLKFYNFEPNGANNRLYKIDIYQACCFMTCNLQNVTNNIGPSEQEQYRSFLL